MAFIAILMLLCFLNLSWYFGFYRDKWLLGCGYWVQFPGLLAVFWFIV